MNIIKQLRKRLNLTQTDFAEKIGVTMHSVQNWENGRATPSIATFEHISDIFGVSRNWLLTGEGEMLKDESGKTERQAKLSDLRKRISELENRGTAANGGTYTVPYFNNVRVSAGYGIEVFDEEPDGVYEMPAKFFAGMNGREIKCLRVSGDSMAPRFDDGDWVFITPMREIYTEGIYVVRVRGALLVKKVQWLPDGLRLISENKEYDPVLLNEDTCPPDEVAIIGKVVLIVTKP